MNTEFYSNIIKDVKGNAGKRIPTMIIASLFLIAGLAWNDAIKAALEYYYPTDYTDAHAAWIKLYHAFILSVIVIFLVTMLLRFTGGESSKYF